MEYPHACSCWPGKASPEIWRPSIAGSGSSSAADHHLKFLNLRQPNHAQSSKETGFNKFRPSEKEDEGSSRTGGRKGEKDEFGSSRVVVAAVLEFQPDIGSLSLCDPLYSGSSNSLLLTRSPNVTFLLTGASLFWTFCGSPRLYASFEATSWDPVSLKNI